MATGTSFCKRLGGPRAPSQHRTTNSTGDDCDRRAGGSGASEPLAEDLVPVAMMIIVRMGGGIGEKYKSTGGRMGCKGGGRIFDYPLGPFASF
ncbi:hypothetical protein E4U13_000366 [Claviceps humidiphila]|uniref:Uncharacterized protein n=1 Tax=Claviceps humidiphila TaxID=1294629 RepID=A0A9P7Q494_9HYPO|nr:hypothetical protein E4U13_000366 [Claviceps humidiphila]